MTSGLYLFECRNRPGIEVVYNPFYLVDCGIVFPLYYLCLIQNPPAFINSYSNTSSLIDYGWAWPGFLWTQASLLLYLYVLLDITANMSRLIAS